MLEEGLKEDELLMITYPEATSSKPPKGKKKKKEVLLVTDDEDNSKAASSKQPQRRIRTRSVMREEKQFQKQEQIFTTYQRKPRKYQQAQSKSALEEDEHIQTLGSQEGNLAGEIGQDIQETDEVIRQTKRINLFLDQQEKEKKKQSKHEIIKDSASPFLEQRTMEGEKKEDSIQENEELGMDTNSLHLPMNMEKKKTSKNSKKIRKLKLEIKELDLRNEKLREVN